MPDPILSIFVAGPPDHPRYQIVIPDLEFWNGENWTENEYEARLFGSVNAVHAIEK